MSSTTPPVSIAELIAKCKKTNVSNDTDELKKHLKRIINGNRYIIAICLLIITLCFFIIAYILNIIYQIVVLYLTRFRPSKPVETLESLKNKDEYIYKSGTNADIIPTAAEIDVLKAKMMDLKNTWKEHNERAMTDTVNKDMVPNDMIDENIISAKYDDVE